MFHWRMTREKGEAGRGEGRGSHGSEALGLESSPCLAPAAHKSMALALIVVTVTAVAGLRGAKPAHAWVILCMPPQAPSIFSPPEVPAMP